MSHLGHAALPMEAVSPHRRMAQRGRMGDSAAVLSKLVPDIFQHRFGQSYSSDSRSNRAVIAPNMSLLSRISDLTANDVNDSQSIFQLLPEMELTMQILVSSILSPKDLSDASISITLEPNRLHGELAGSMLNVLTEHFTKVHKISEMLQPALENMLFHTGADPMMILPESSIDRAINGSGRISMESISGEFDITNNRVRPIGFLGNPSTEAKPTTSGLGVSLESLFQSEVKEYDEVVRCEGKPELVSVVDNPNILKLSRMKDRLIRDRARSLLANRELMGTTRRTAQVSMENYTSYQHSLTRGRDVMNGGVGAQHVPLQIMTTETDNRRPSVGHPLVMRLPTEAVIPVHQPSNPEAHLGYFIILDELGNPVTRVDERDYYSDMSDSLNKNSGMSSQLISQVRRQMEGRSMDRQSEINEMAMLYGQFMEKDLTERLRAGIYGSGAEVTAPTEVYRVMFARAMARQHTQLLYVPAELMVYFAFDYNKYGIGQSLLQQSKILGGIRVMMLFADTMAAIKNSVNHTTVEMNIDPNDPYPSQTVEFMMTEFAKTRQAIFPLGASSANDIVTYLQRAAVNVVVNGNTRYPTTRMDVSERATNRIQPNTELQKDLRDRHLMAIGLTPDQVDGAGNAEFATSILSNNLLLAKRVLRYQKKLEALVKEFIQKYVLADGDLMGELRSLVDKNRNKLTAEQQRSQELTDDVKEQRKTLTGGKDVPALESIDQKLESLEEMGLDAVVMEFLQNVRVQLPKPDTSTLKSQMEAFKEQKDAYAEVLETAYINSSYLETNGLGGLSDLVDSTKEAILAELMRDWMRTNNVMPELTRLVNLGNDEDRPDFFKNITEHVKSMSGSFLRMLYHMAKIRGKNDPSVKRLKDILEASGEDTSSSDSWGSSGSDYGSDPGSDTTDPFADTGGGMDDLPPLDDVVSDEPAPENEETPAETTDAGDTGEEEPTPESQLP